MKARIYFALISLSVISGTLFSLASCSGDPKINSDTTYEYTPSGSVELTSSDEYTSAENTHENISGGKYTVNDEWKNNFKVVYVQKTNKETVECTEKKCESSFIAEERSIAESHKITEYVSYFKTNGSDIDYYKIAEGNGEYEHKVYEDTEFILDESRFIHYFCLHEDVQLKLEKNALYMRDENVAGRLCCRYLLGEYKDGERTKHIYIWIDVQYGFIAKLEIYDAEGNLLEQREIKEFSVGNMTEEDVYIDISQYDFKEIE